jgi:hypothetical protein
MTGGVAGVWWSRPCSFLELYVANKDVCAGIASYLLTGNADVPTVSGSAH